jgi:hypothetical protein
MAPRTRPQLSRRTPPVRPHTPTHTHIKPPANDTSSKKQSQISALWSPTSNALRQAATPRRPACGCCWRLVLTSLLHAGGRLQPEQSHRHAREVHTRFHTRSCIPTPIRHGPDTCAIRPGGAICFSCFSRPSLHGMAPNFGFRRCRAGARAGTGGDATRRRAPGAWGAAVTAWAPASHTPSARASSCYFGVCRPQPPPASPPARTASAAQTARGVRLERDTGSWQPRPRGSTADHSRWSCARRGTAAEALRHTSAVKRVATAQSRSRQRGDPPPHY